MAVIARVTARVNRTGGTGAYMRHDFDVLRLARHIFLLLCSNPTNLPLYGILSISSVKLYLVDGQTNYSAVAVDSQRSWIPDADEPKCRHVLKASKTERRHGAHFSYDGQHRRCHRITIAIATDRHRRSGCRPLRPMTTPPKTQSRPRPSMDCG